MIGEPLPDGNPLPHPDELMVCAGDWETRSNLRTEKSGPYFKVSSKGCGMKFEPYFATESDGAEGGFGGFEQFEGQPTQTTIQQTWQQKEFTWDSSFEEGKL